MGVRDESRFEPRFVRSVTRCVWLGRALRLTGWLVIPPLLLIAYLFALVIVTGIAYEWNTWRTGNYLQTDGTVTGKETEVVGNETRLAYVIDYEFTHEGTIYSDSESIDRGRYSRLEIGDPIPVIYVEDSPEVSRIGSSPKSFGFKEYACFGLFAFVVLIPFGQTALWIRRRIRGLPGGREKARAELLRVRTLTQTDVDSAPRAIIDLLSQRRFPQEDLLEQSRRWLNWDGRTEVYNGRPTGPLESFGCFPWDPIHPERNPLLKWLKSHPGGNSIEDLLARVDYVHRRGFRRYRKLEPIATSMPPRIKGPDDPLLEEWAFLMSNEQERPRALKILRRLTGDSENAPGDFDSFRLELKGLDREEAIDHIEYQMEELKKETRSRKELLKQRKNGEVIYVTECGSILMKDYEAFLYRVSPRTYPLILARGDTEELLTSLRIPEAVVFVHDLLYFFYCCPWRWKPVVREVELESQAGAICPVRFSFTPGEEIRVDRL